MTFEGALAALRDGRAVRRRRWPEGGYVRWVAGEGKGAIKWSIPGHDPQEALARIIGGLFGDDWEAVE